MDKAVQREIFDLKVYCRHKMYGCNWNGTVADYAQVSLLLCHKPASNTLIIHWFIRHMKRNVTLYLRHALMNVVN